MKVAALIVDELMASLNVMETVAVVGTFAAPFAGLTALTVGGVVSGAGDVVKDDVKLAAMALPATSITPVVTVTV
jgi:hypothetical protein